MFAVPLAWHEREPLVLISTRPRAREGVRCSVSEQKPSRIASDGRRESWYGSALNCGRKEVRGNYSLSAQYWSGIRLASRSGEKDRIKTASQAESQQGRGAGVAVEKRTGSRLRESLIGFQRSSLTSSAKGQWTCHWHLRSRRCAMLVLQAETISYHHARVSGALVSLGTSLGQK